MEKNSSKNSLPLPRNR